MRRFPEINAMRGGLFEGLLRSMSRRQSGGGAGADHAEEMLEQEKVAASFIGPIGPHPSAGAEPNDLEGPQGCSSHVGRTVGSIPATGAIPDEFDLMRANVARLRSNEKAYALRVSREHYLLMADEIERLIEIERRLDEILNVRAVAI